MAGPELLLIGAGLQVVQGIQANQQAKAQAKLARQTADYNAALIDQQAGIESQQARRRSQILQGQQRVRAAASGASLSSFEDVFEDTTSQSLLDQALINYDRKVNRQQAIYRGEVEASSAKAQGRGALISSIASAALTASSGFLQTPSQATGGGGKILRPGTARATPIPGRRPF